MVPHHYRLRDRGLVEAATWWCSLSLTFFLSHIAFPDIIIAQIIVTRTVTQSKEWEWEFDEARWSTTEHMKHLMQSFSKCFPLMNFRKSPPEVTFFHFASISTAIFDILSTAGRAFEFAQWPPSRVSNCQYLVSYPHLHQHLVNVSFVLSVAIESSSIHIQSWCPFMLSGYFDFGNRR